MPISGCCKGIISSYDTPIIDTTRHLWLMRPAGNNYSKMIIFNLRRSDGVTADVYWDKITSNYRLIDDDTYV